jgi:hypothetical protein
MHAAMPLPAGPAAISGARWMNKQAGAVSGMEEVTGLGKHARSPRRTVLKAAWRRLGKAARNGKAARARGITTRRKGRERSGGRSSTIPKMSSTAFLAMRWADSLQIRFRSGCPGRDAAVGTVRHDVLLAESLRQGIWARGGIWNECAVFLRAPVSSQILFVAVASVFLSSDACLTFPRSMFPLSQFSFPRVPTTCECIA